MTNYKEIQDRYELNTYAKRDITILKGEGAKVWSDTGVEYIDCIGGIAVANVGHCNQKVVEALYEQSKKLITLANVFYNDARAKAFEKVVEVAPPNIKKVFFTNSGAESVEAALKFARLITGKTDFIVAMKAFHGRTFGALSATYKEEYREGFGPLLSGFTHVPYNKFEKLEAAVTDKTAGILLEVVQGEGGINLGSPEYFQAVRKLCDEKGIMLIIDEIQTGFCRTGKFFAIEHFGFEADMITVAKGIAGGYPVGAVLCSDKIQIATGKHGTTFGGNPLGCAAVTAAITYMQENNLAKQAEEKGNYFVQKLSGFELSKVRAIRNLGMLIGIECKDKVKQYVDELMNEKVLVMPAGQTVLRIVPPLVISYEELDIVIEKLVKVLN